MIPVKGSDMLAMDWIECTLGSNKWEAGNWVTMINGIPIIHHSIDQPLTLHRYLAACKMILEWEHPTMLGMEEIYCTPVTSMPNSNISNVLGINVTLSKEVNLCLASPWDTDVGLITVIYFL